MTFSAYEQFIKLLYSFLYLYSMKDIYGYLTIMILFALLMIAFNWSNILANVNNPVYIALFLNFFMLLGGSLLIGVGIDSAKNRTDKRMGYGPYVNYFHVGRYGSHWYSWPADYYQRDSESKINYSIIKEEFKPKVNAWWGEFKKSKRTDVWYNLGILLVVISVIIFITQMISSYYELYSSLLENNL